MISDRNIVIHFTDSLVFSRALSPQKTFKNFLVRDVFLWIDDGLAYKTCNKLLYDVGISHMHTKVVMSGIIHSENIYCITLKVGVVTKMNITLHKKVRMRERS